MDRTQQPAQRELVFCHQCENEWYRDEHGIVCPDCHSDFTEIIEANHDPREDNMHIPADVPEHYALNQHTHPHRHEEHYAPDPDEEDIDNLANAGWIGHAPGEQVGPHSHSTFNRAYTPGGQQREGQQQGQPQGQQQAGSLLGAIGSLFGNAMGGGQPQQQQRSRPQSSSAVDRSPSMPGAPRGGTTSTFRHIQGPGFQMTFESHSGGNLFPRNANGAQPINRQPEDIQDMMHQMMVNIMGPQGIMYAAGPGHPQQQHPFHGAPAGPFGNIFQLLAGGAGGQFGDAVYSQEALDRVITQLMEQHQTGHAPGPAAEAAIKALPTRAITAEDLGESGKAECSICMDEVLPGATVTELPCHHWFHGECIHAWLTEHDTCPHCRKGITPKPEGDGQGSGSADASRPRQPGQPPLNDMSQASQQMGVPSGFSSESAMHDHWPQSAGASGSRQGNTSGTSGSGSGSGSGMLGRRMRDVFGGGNQDPGPH